MKNKKYLLTAIFLILAFVITGFLSEEGFHWNNLKYTGNAITSDEVSHISDGYYYLKTGKYFINNEHPPLVKDISAIPSVLFLKPTLPEISDKISIPETAYDSQTYPFKSYVFPENLEIQNLQWIWGDMFLFNPNNNPDAIAFWARLSVAIFNGIFLFLLYFFLSKIWSKKASLIALFLIASSQLFLAHGSLVTMDFMTSILQMLAIVVFAIYLKKYAENSRNIKWFLLSSFFIFLALVSKFNAFIIIPVLFLGGLIFIIFEKKNWKEVFKYLLRFISLSIVVLIGVSVFYYFHTKNMDNSKMIYQVVMDYPKGAPFLGIEIMSSMVINNPITKGLAEYMVGVIMVLTRMAQSYQYTYFLGKVYADNQSNLLYFPVLFLTKLSIGLLSLIFIGLGIAIRNIVVSRESLRNGWQTFMENPLPFILFSFIYLYMVTTFSSNLQIGIRHILPVITAVILLTAKELDYFWDRKLFNILKTKYLFFAIAITIAISTAISFPYYISYYNYFGGGTWNGYKIATDSNYDWGGQDVKRLAEWAKENNINKIYTDIFTNVPLKYYLGDSYENFDISNDEVPNNAYIAVSVFKYQNNVFSPDLTDNQKYTKLKDYFYKRIGTTMMIFKTP